MNLIISGADGSLGAAVLARFQAAGDRVATLHRQPALTDAAAGRFVANDLSDESEARHVIDAAASWLGHVDAFVHLVGRFIWQEVGATKLATWRAMFEVNLASAVASAGAVLPHLVDNGAIVLVGAQPARAGFGPYGASKAGVARLTEALAAGLAPRGIRTNAILPAVIDTARNRRDMPGVDPEKWTSARAIADVIAFLVSPAARTISGALLPVTNAA